MPPLFEITRCSRSLCGLHLRCSDLSIAPELWQCSAIPTLPCRARSTYVCLSPHKITRRIFNDQTFNINYDVLKPAQFTSFTLFFQGRAMEARQFFLATPLHACWIITLAPRSLECKCGVVELLMWLTCPRLC